MTRFGFASYIIAAVFYALLAFLLCTSWRGRLQGGLLLLAVMISVLWAAAGAYAGNIEFISLKHYLAIEVLRNMAWTAFLWHLLSYTNLSTANHWLRPSALGYALLCAVTLWFDLAPQAMAQLNQLTLLDFRILSHVAQAIIGLFLVEQLYRNTRLELRWGIKFLCLGLGGMFVYDFVLFTESLLFNRIDPYIWDARGIINAIIVPFVAVSAARNPQWSVDIFISRRVVFHTTALLATGIYLLASATIAYYIRDFGGSWGRAGQVVFVFGSLLILVLLMFSGRIRASVKVFFNQHFFTYKYDYRNEWLRLNQTLAAAGSTEHLKEACIKVVADIVDSSGGALWGVSADGSYRLAAELNIPPPEKNEVNTDDSLVKFLHQRQWVVELPEYQQTPELYEGLDLEPWHQMDNLWLVVPLIKGAELYGFIALIEPRAPRKINWEDHDLLKTVGQQLANYLALREASMELASARQFEAYNRLSAFIVHDLKNLVAQLNLIVENADRHKGNPEFIDDAIETLANSVGKMNRLLAQLRKGNIASTPTRLVDLAEVLRAVAEQQGQALPVPELELPSEPIELRTDFDKLVAVLGHLVQNAQEATANDGNIRLSLYNSDNQAIIIVQDNGSGMDAQFVRERLFQPFETTKGNAGMGIGVFETSQFVKDQGGKIEVESEPGEGTRFTLRFPITQERAIDEEDAAEALGKPETLGKQG